jgi:oxalate decarboxylase/phosphoglucose isomerase-like protein (cupin superfamily)
MHVHHLQEEGLTVERGTMGYQVLGEEERRADPGQGATFAPGVGHRFWNAGDDELIFTGFARPPDNLEYSLAASRAWLQAIRGTGATGLEPAASGVTGRRSKPTELRPRMWRAQGSRRGF